MSRDYQILGVVGQDVRAAAQFMYKGRLISFSTMFTNPSRVTVFSKDGMNDCEFDTVELAIEYVNTLGAAD